MRVLSCDTVTQAKEKILDVIYRNAPYRNQLRPTDLHMSMQSSSMSFTMLYPDILLFSLTHF